MTVSLNRLALGGALCVGTATACRTARRPETFDHCDRFPADSVPPPAIDAHASADSPRVLFLSAETSGPYNSIVVVLDQQGGIAHSGRARFAEVLPGPHRLRVRSFGYGERDTVITMPSDSSLSVHVTLTKGGGISGCSSYIIIE